MWGHCLQSKKVLHGSVLLPFLQSLWYVIGLLYTVRASILTNKTKYFLVSIFIKIIWTFIHPQNNTFPIIITNMLNIRH